jgi:hypothetical protein
MKQPKNSRGFISHGMPEQFQAVIVKWPLSLNRLCLPCLKNTRLLSHGMTELKNNLFF